MVEDFERICFVAGSHSGARRASRRAGGGPRAVVARGGAGRPSRHKKRGETQGPPHCRDGGQEVGEIGCQEKVSEHGGTHTRQAGGVMPRRRIAALVVQFLPRRQRAQRGILSPFLSQRGGWISGSVPKPPGYDMTRWLLARGRGRRAQPGGWIGGSVPKAPGYDVTRWVTSRMRIKRRRRRR